MEDLDRDSQREPLTRVFWLLGPKTTAREHNEPTKLKLAARRTRAGRALATCSRHWCSLGTSRCLRVSVVDGKDAHFHFLVHGLLQPQRNPWYSMLGPPAEVTTEELSALSCGAGLQKLKWEGLSSLFPLHISLFGKRIHFTLERLEHTAYSEEADEIFWG